MSLFSRICGLTVRAGILYEEHRCFELEAALVVTPCQTFAASARA
jgi:hypothetical protein